MQSKYNIQYYPGVCWKVNVVTNNVNFRMSFIFSFEHIYTDLMCTVCLSFFVTQFLSRLDLQLLFSQQRKQCYKNYVSNTTTTKLFKTRSKVCEREGFALRFKITRTYTLDSKNSEARQYQNSKRAKKNTKVRTLAQSIGNEWRPTFIHDRRLTSTFII